MRAWSCTVTGSNHLGRFIATELSVSEREMAELALQSLVAIPVLGVGAQWLAGRFGVPSILLLCLFAPAAGPLTGFLRPDIRAHAQ